MFMMVSFQNKLEPKSHFKFLPPPSPSAVSLPLRLPGLLQLAPGLQALQCEF